MKRCLVAAVILSAGLFSSIAEAGTLCTLIVEAKSGRIVLQEGNCSERVTPASTFKVALGVMGYDAGFLKDEHDPVLPFRKGYIEWGGDNWRQPTDAPRWMKYSVVWFSQQITHALGEKKLHDYAVKFGYGNADFSGDEGKNNGLERSWIGSSLRISPLEQAAFLRRLVNRELPASRHAQDMTLKVVESFSMADGTAVQGKTGSAFPRKADGSFDREHSWGWFIGWTKKEDGQLVFVRFIQDETDLGGATGLRARDAFLAELPGLLKGK